MSPCTRFEVEGLAALEEGRPLDEHFRTCPDCIAAAAQHDRLKRALGSLEAAEPREGWEGRLWSRLEARRRRGTPWAHVLAVGLAAAVAAVVLWPRVPPASRALLVQVEEGQGRRGLSAPALTPVPGLRSAESLTGPLPIGSRLVVTASPGAAFHAELRVYRNDVELVLQTTVASGSRAVVLLDAIGRYRALLVTSSGPIPAPSGSLDGDVAALPAGVEVVLGPEIAVR